MTTLDPTTIQVDDFSLIELTKREGGGFNLTIHVGHEESGRWDDLSVGLSTAKSAQLIDALSIPEQGVKPLRFEKQNIDGTLEVSEVSVSGEYRVKFNGQQWEAIRGILLIGTADDSTSACALCQQEHRRIVLSALSLPSHPAAVADPLGIEAAKNSVPHPVSGSPTWPEAAAVAVTDEMVTEALKTFSRLCGVPWDKEPGDARDAMRDALEAARITQSVDAGNAVVVEPVLLTDGNAPLPFQRDELGRMVREAWVRWAKTQPTPKPSWLVPYKELNEADKEADRQIGEAISRWTIVGIAARPTPPHAGVSELIQALEQIASYAGKTLISTEHGQPYSIGANAAFEEVAAIASAALVDRDRVK